MRCLVTGGAGFIGSHIVDRLIKDGHEVIVYDNLSTGNKRFIAHHFENEKFTLIEADVLDLATLKKQMQGCDFVFHLQANADVRGGKIKRRVDLEQNSIATWNVLEAMTENNVKKIAFASSGTVYGEPDVFPTPETYPLIQTSLYGASKQHGEALIQAYCEYFDMQCWIFRFVSWIGPRYTHGVVFDFVYKLQNNPNQLEILGDGQQKKSYLDVVDGVSGIFFAIEQFNERKNIFNLGHTDFLNVVKLADVVGDELGLRPTYQFTGGKRGWVGDSPIVHLDVKKLMDKGWKPTISIEEGIRRTVRYLKENPQVFDKRKAVDGKV